MEKSKNVAETPPVSVGSEIVAENCSTESCTDQILSDISLSKTEELLLQQNFLNLPLLDDKMTFSQQIDVVNCKKKSVMV